MVQKTTLHNLIDILNDRDTETIYQLLIHFISTDTAMPDEIKAYEKGLADIENGNIIKLEDIDLDD